MKRIPLLLMVTALCFTANMNAQDAAMEERLNKLGAQIEDLRAAQELQQKRLTDLAKDIDGLREQLNRPNTTYANQDDLRKLTEKLQEIDQKRVTDNEQIAKAIEKLGKTLGGAAGGKKPGGGLKPATPDNAGDGGTGKETGIKYTITKGDTLSVIVQACKEKGIKVTVDQILKANPGLKPNSLQVGQEIFIPASQP